MNKLWRIIDAELDRVTEGLRVIEDIAGFYREHTAITSETKVLRSKIAGLTHCFRSNLLEYRNLEADLGLELSQKLGSESKHQLMELATANLKRVQEGLRSLEEHLKVLDYYQLANEFEALRFQSYTLEKKIFTEILMASERQFPNTDLYCLTASKYSLNRSNQDVVKQILDAGVKIIQYREKDFKMLQKYRECIALRELTAQYDAFFIINDDLHLAQAVEADGIHLGQDDLPVEKAWEIVGDKMIIGLSTHSPAQADQAVLSGVDYIGVGPIFQTATKKDVCAPVGLEYLDYIVKTHQIPLVAIGGIKLHNVAEVVRHGAGCIAMVTDIVGAKDIDAQINAVRAKIIKAKEYA